LHQHYHVVADHEDAPGVGGKGRGLAGRPEGAADAGGARGKGKGEAGPEVEAVTASRFFRRERVHGQACLGLGLVGTSAPQRPDVRAVGTKIHLPNGLGIVQRTPHPIKFLEQAPPAVVTLGNHVVVVIVRVGHHPSGGDVINRSRTDREGYRE
jgi:hypothetical protein